MSKQAVTAASLIRACADDGRDTGITIQSTIEPIAGPGAPVKPAVYEGGKYQLDRRWHGEGEDRRIVDVVVIDNVPSQANRLEHALLDLRVTLGLPELLLDLSGIPGLPVHLPSQISSFAFPHRNADAYLRDAQLEGTKFLQTTVGQEIFAATADEPDALYEWLPQALLFGFWQSHLGKKRQQTKLARSWVSEIVGYEPATVETSTMGLKGDPLNLSVDAALAFDETDLVSWDMTNDAKGVKGKGKSENSLSNIGHGQVPVAGGPSGVSFRSIEQRSSVSIAALRRIGGKSPEAAAAGRALLVAIGLAAHVGAFGRSFSLRSGCELRTAFTRWVWLGADEDADVEPLLAVDAQGLVSDTAEAARAAGLPVGSSWATEALRLEPQDNLRKVIEKSFPLRDGE